MNRVCFALLLGLVGSALARPWSEDVIYFALTDRFADGDASNNVPPGSDPALYDASHQDISRYHGGDFRGLEHAIASGYFNDLGITAIWITPPVKNVWRSGFDLGGPKTGYHGYWAQDFLDIDPHLTSAKALDGTSYPDGPKGRMKHYKDLVTLAHSKGLKIIQDVVMNHAGPVFYYDTNGDGRFERDAENEWIQPYKRDGFYPNAMSADIPEWNLHRTAPEGPVERLGVKIPTTGILSKLETYSRKGFSNESLGKTDGEEITCDFFSLRDIWTAPGSAQFDALVDEFVEIYAFYLTTVGVDGLRVDTVKHVHPAFWDAFTERLRTKLGDQAKDISYGGAEFAPILRCQREFVIRAREARDSLAKGRGQEHFIAARAVAPGDVAAARVIAVTNRDATGEFEFDIGRRTQETRRGAGREQEQRCSGAKAIHGSRE